MAGSCKPDNVGPEMTNYSVNNSTHHSRNNYNPPSILVNGAIGSGTKGGRDWNYAGDYIYVTFNEACNIWRYGNSSYKGQRSRLTISPSTYECQYDLTTYTWELFVKNIQPGTYKFSHGNGARYDTEWYFEKLAIYSLSVISNTGTQTSIRYFTENVTISTALYADSYHKFDHWEVVSGNVVFIGNSTSYSTTIQIQQTNVTIKAVYKQLYELHVITDYVKDSVSICEPSLTYYISSPKEINGKQIFHHWEVIDGDVTLSNVNYYNPYFKMPSKNVTIKAYYSLDTKIRNSNYRDNAISKQTFNLDIFKQHR